jgi:DNA replication protein DnaC
LLIIDEVGKGIDKIEREIYPYMVNEFYGNRNTLVFLGNADKAEFDSLIGEAGADRMREVGVYMALTGESRRGQKK